MTQLRAPAKLNLCLFVGSVRADGLHELVSVFEPVELHDVLEVATADTDSVECEGVEGPDLSARALGALRQAGWEMPPLRIRVRKSVPVAAGMGGGSADAAAVLRLAAVGEHRIPGEQLQRIAFDLGADVPAQLDPVLSLVGGAGERVEPLGPPAPHAIVVVPSAEGLSTADVYGEADRLGIGRDRAELAAAEAELRGSFAGGADPLALVELLVNDLQPAALSLRPDLAQVMAALGEAGAAHAMVTGSGPTVFGLFAAPGAAHLAAHQLGERFGRAIVTGPLLSGGTG